MPLDPTLARGITPLGEGVPNTLAQIGLLRQRDNYNALQQQELGMQQSRYAQEDQAAQRKELVRQQLKEMMLYKDAPPEIKAQYVALQRQKHPEFANTPFASMPPEQAFSGMLDGLMIELGMQPRGEAETGIKIGQYNPGDYTPESWAGFLQSKDPSGLKRQYAPPAPANMSVIQLPGGQAAFNPRTAGIIPLSDRNDQIAAEAAAKEAEAAASARGQAAVEKDTKSTERQMAWQLYETAMSGLKTGLAGTNTGPVTGRIPAVTAGQQTAEGGVAAMAPVLKQLFRVAGEGVFTDRDQALLLEMIPKRTDLPAAREAKIANIDSIVRAKLGVGGQAAPSVPPRRRYNPQTRKIE